MQTASGIGVEKEHAFAAPMHSSQTDGIQMAGDLQVGLVANLLGVNHENSNYGVRVLLSGALESLAAASPNCIVRTVDYGHVPTSYREITSAGEKVVEQINLRFSWKLFLPNNIFALTLFTLLIRALPMGRHGARLLALNPWLRRIMEARLSLSLAGGDSFSDIYGVRRFLYVSLPQLLVLWLGQPLILLPQTYGPFNGWISRKVAAYIFERACAIYSRDEAGVDLINRVRKGRGVPVKTAPDLGFLMDSEPVPGNLVAELNRWRKGRNIVGLNVSKLLYMGGYTGKNMFGLRENYKALVDAVVSRLVSETDACVLLIPHVHGADDGEESERPLCRDLVKQYERAFPGKVIFFDEEMNHRQIKGLIGCCDVFTGARMHACIGAVSQCVPTVALAYSDKFAGVMRLAAASVQVVDLRSAAVEDVLAGLKSALIRRGEFKQQLAGQMPRIRREIGGIFQTKALEKFYRPAVKPSGLSASFC